MIRSEVSASRHLLPRWRTLSRTPAIELRHIGEQIRSAPFKGRPNVALLRWQSTRSLEDAADAIDCAIVTGNLDDISDPLSMVLHPTSDAVPALRKAAAKLLHRPKHSSGADNLPEDDFTPARIVPTIRGLKRRIELAPRDAVSYVEMGRLYSLLGQLRPAESCIEKAVALSPNNRFVIRSAVRYYNDRGNPERALELVSRSEAVISDPWVQAAEAATADKLGKTPKRAIREIRTIADSKQLDTSRSELAASLATINFKQGGNSRITRSLLRAALSSPTENALAQAFWLDQSASSNIGMQVQMESTQNASEARTRNALVGGRIELAASECHSWFVDEPFSSIALAFAISINLTHLGRYDAVRKYVNIASQVYKSHWHFANAKILCDIYEGKLASARAEMSSLQSSINDVDAAPFVFAAQGLLAFHEGRVEDGRVGYEMAVIAANHAGSLMNARMAMIYWLEQEIRYGLIADEDRDKFLGHLNKDFAKMPPAQSRELNQILKSRLALVEREMETQMRGPMQKIAEVGQFRLRQDGIRFFLETIGA